MQQFGGLGRYFNMLRNGRHSAAHSEEPPIPIERLKVMDLWKVD
tara:strand:+ start:96 stop:227 length:132 start_codon:yes stop_codon:yes gene_type:complete